jgi:hypothetical protein
MKKKILFAVTIFISSLGYTQNVSFGIKVGSNISNIRITGTSKTGYRAGFHAGGLAHVKLSRQFALQPELTYSTQGYKSGGFRNSTTILKYINLPAMVQLKLTTVFQLQAGPQIGFLIGAKNKYGGNVYDLNIKRSYRLVDIAYSLGLGYLNKSRVGFDVRWIRSLIPITLRGVDLNNVFQVGLFYQISRQKDTHR